MLVEGGLEQAPHCASPRTKAGMTRQNFSTWLVAFHPGVYFESATDRSLFLILGFRLFEKQGCAACRTWKSREHPSLPLSEKNESGVLGREVRVGGCGDQVFRANGGRSRVLHLLSCRGLALSCGVSPCVVASPGHRVTWAHLP